jgi:hypothetical protein
VQIQLYKLHSYGKNTVSIKVLLPLMLACKLQKQLVIIRMKLGNLYGNTHVLLIKYALQILKLTSPCEGTDVHATSDTTWLCS